MQFVAPITEEKVPAGQAGHACCSPQNGKFVPKVQFKQLEILIDPDEVEKVPG